MKQHQHHHHQYNYYLQALLAASKTKLRPLPALVLLVTTTIACHGFFSSIRYFQLQPNAMLVEQQIIIENEASINTRILDEVNVHKTSDNNMNKNAQVTISNDIVASTDNAQVTINNNDNDHHNNRTLVIIMGSLRGGENAWKSLYENVLDLNHADLALAVGYNPNKNTSSLYQRAKYLWEFHEYDDWADALDLINNNDTSWRSLIEVKSVSELLGGVKGLPGSGAIIFWIRWFITNKINELGLTKKYDRFVVTRSDHFYWCQHDLSRLDLQEVWVPTGENYHGVTDRHVVASAEKILDVLDMFPWLLSHPDEGKELWRIRAGARPERYIKYRWKKMGIIPKQFPRMMFTCSVPGDSTRWQVASTEIELPNGAGKLKLKYPQEYYASKSTCSRKTKKSKKKKS